jgi:hypothetical protein
MVLKDVSDVEDQSVQEQLVEQLQPLVVFAFILLQLLEQLILFLMLLEQ